MEQERVVTHERGVRLGEELGMPFFEASAKNDVNVSSIFDKLVDMICEAMANSLDSDPTMTAAVGGPDVIANPNPPQESGCHC